jgi:hypothetical protein
MFSQITTKSSVSVQRYFLPEDIYLSTCSGTETTFLIIMSPAILQSRVFIKFVLKVGVEDKFKYIKIERLEINRTNKKND